MLRKPFVPPSKRPQTLSNTNNVNPTELDVEGWRALYDTTYHKTVEYKERNRFHTGLMREAEEAKDTEKPELPLTNIQNALIFKRMNTRRQLLGNLM